MTKRFFSVAGVLLAILTMGALPALANHIDTAIVTDNCTSFTLTVAGSNIDRQSPGIAFEIRLTDPSGSYQVVEGSAPVTLQPDLSFSITITKNWSDYGIVLDGSECLSGTVMMTFDNGASFDPSVPLTFSTPCITCPDNCTGTIGDFVWEDVNPNGLQDAGEPGINNVTVTLMNGSGAVLAMTTTSGNGFYQFGGLCAGQYKVSVTPPAGFGPTTPCGVDPNMPTDSNCSPAVIDLPTNGSSNPTIDFGLVRGSCTNPPSDITGPADACVGSTNTYTGPDGANLGYLWSITDGPCSFSGSNTARSVQLNASGAGTCTLSLKVTDNSTGCNSTSTQSVCVKPGGTCAPIGQCTVQYPFASANPLTSVPFNESEVLRAFTVTVAPGCTPDQIRLFYSDEHALTLGVRRVNVKTTSGTTTTNYSVSPLLTVPGSVSPPQVGTTATTGDQAGTDLSGRPLFPALYITDTTANSDSTACDWQSGPSFPAECDGHTAVPPSAVFGTWKAAVKTIDKTRTPNVVTVTPDADPALNHWNLGAGDQAPAGATDQGFGAEARWDVSQLGLVTGHTYRLYFMVHDGDQNKTGGDVGQGCAKLETQPTCSGGPAACQMDYPFASGNPRSSIAFNESEVLRAFSPSTAGPGDTLKVWYSDEHALTLGVRAVNVKTASGTTSTNFAVTPQGSNPGAAVNPLVGTKALTGDAAGTDTSDRPIWPSLFITDITTNPDNKACDWQSGPAFGVECDGRTAIPPTAVFGTWKAAVRTVDKTKVPALVTVTPDADPAKNNWNLGAGDAPPTGLTNEGYGAEATWSVDALIDAGIVIPGRLYRVQFMVHDGDQNKVGGDVGENCGLVTIGGLATCEVNTQPLQNRLPVLQSGLGR